MWCVVIAHFLCAGVPWLVLAGPWDCLTAGDSCSSDEACSPRLRTLRQCVAGGGSVKLGPGARNHCENAVTALLASPLHRCQCKRGMKREKNCLSIYWSLKQSVIHGNHTQKSKQTLTKSLIHIPMMSLKPLY